MHILIVTDQHPESLGGAQVAIRGQRAAAEAAGHTVTIAAPALHRPGYAPSPEVAAAYIDLPSRAITGDREYGLTWATARTDRALARALRSRPPVDLVHLQGDFWGALIGLRAARGLGVPVVHTLHNNLDHGTRAVTPFAPLAFQGLRLWRALALGRVRGTVPARAQGAWRYLGELAAEADVVTAPSQHFADQLMARGVAERVVVTRNGIDDAVIADIRELPRTERTRPKLVWLGRMSAEKRVLEFIEAFAESGVDADVTLYGAGTLFVRAQSLANDLGVAAKVRFAGAVSHREALIGIRDADVLVQTSVGFETQGLTPFEAALLGTPTIFCDANIAADAAVTPAWQVPDTSVTALSETIQRAVAAVRANEETLRVSAEQSEAFLQSKQAELLLNEFEQLLR